MHSPLVLGESASGDLLLTSLLKPLSHVWLWLEDTV
jgi:hypothetical protein